jgi:exopolysaccharide production protein ExoQ|tara:strand:+ start:1653 stop:2954 length:1302 start_codon:yes stop_codon:yes gene_type:complete
VWLAYPGLFLALAGDAVRYSIGWGGWSVAVVMVTLASIYALSVSKPVELIRIMPTALVLLLGWMMLSLTWSSYLGASFMMTGLQISATLFALFLASQFSWRQLLNILSNLIRFILGTSLVFELFAGITGPVIPLFPNFEGDTVPYAAYYWSQGNLFDGGRIQGIVGNANLLAFTAVLGALLFLVEAIVTSRKRLIPVISLGLAVLLAVLSQSASMTLAVVIIGFAAIIAILAEGRSRQIRHQIYWSAGAIAGLAVASIVINLSAVFDLLGKSPDASGRFLIWSEVLTLIWQKPGFGWGWIGYWVPGVAPYEGLIVMNGVPMYQAHNAYLDIFMQLGVVGLCLLVWLLAVTFVRLWTVAVRHTNPLYLFPLFIFLVIAAQSISESRLLIEAGWVLLVLLAAKSAGPFAELEPLGRTGKRSRLAGNFRLRPRARL